MTDSLNRVFIPVQVSAFGMFDGVGLDPGIRISVKIFTYEPRLDKTNKMSVRPAKTQISLGIRPVCSGSSLCAQWIGKDPRFFHADSED